MNAGQADGASAPASTGIAAAGIPKPPAQETPPPAEVVTTFGRLESVRIRDYWKDEARDFTPWLASEENLGILGETIALNLELVGIEQRVGPFRADIVARDESHFVIIENQLDATDHKHLGQLLVYAADRNARTVVWVARQVTDEYRKVIDWLNEETSANFWALEIELWRIGDSPVAPKFNVVCEPNELTKPIGDGEGSKEPSGVGLVQLEFWTAFSEHLDQSDTSVGSRRARAQNWYLVSIGTARGYVSLTMLVGAAETPGRLGCEFYLPHSSANFIFKELLAQREAIELELDLVGQLEWQALPERIACRVAHYREANFDDRESWPALFEWLENNAEAFKSAFLQRVKDIALPEPEVHTVTAGSEVAQVSTADEDTVTTGVGTDATPA